MAILQDPRDLSSFVTLTPPLPLAAASGQTGFVTALAVDRLKVELAVATTDARLVDVRVATGAGRLFTFANLALVTVPNARSCDAVITTDADKERLANLLTLVRKSQHIALCETEDVEAKDRYTGLDHVLLRPRALPEMALSELDTRVTFLGKTFARPFLITGMTGGLERGAEINRRLALAAQALGIPMGVGSQRLALDHPEHAEIFRVKTHAPKVFLIGNLGVAQLLRPDAADWAERAVAMIEADALALHVNVLQEVIQVEGDRDFRGLLARIGEVVKRLPVPVLVKEVGCGIDSATARRLSELGVAAIDVGGKGGTSWNYIEGLRAEGAETRAVASEFRDFGIPTGVAVSLLRRALPHASLVATGGIRDGLTAAKAIGIGADLAGIGLPLLRAALKDDDAPRRVLEVFDRGLKTAMIGAGARDLKALRARVAPLAPFLDLRRAYEEETPG